MTAGNSALLGRLDAWDTREQEYLTKLDGFVEVDQYARILERDRCFLCGRRGAGKSAIAVVAESRQGAGLTVTIEGESEYSEYLHVVHHLVERNEAGGHLDVTRIVSELWRYGLTVAVLQSLIRNASEFASPSACDNLGLIAEYLRDCGCTDLHLGQVLLQELVRGDEAYLRCEMPSYARFAQYCSSLATGADLDVAMDAAQALLDEKPLLLILDTLESYEVFRHSMILGLRGVVGAVRGLLRERRFENLDIRFFMPAEVFDYVADAMPQKTVERSVFLEWRFRELLLMLTLRHIRMLQTKGIMTAGEASARELEAREVFASASAAKHLREDYWYANGFLPRSIENASGKDEDTLAYLLRHTQRRPRELILVLNSVLEMAERDNGLPNAVSQDHVRHGLHRRSTLQALVSEAIGPHRGYLDHVVDRARSAFYGQNRFMTGSDLRRFAKSLFSLGPVDGVDEDDFVHVLLRSGVIGLITDDGTPNPEQPYIEAEFEYLIGGHLPFSPSQSYCVHPALGDLFDMKRPDEGFCVFPRPSDDEERFLHGMGPAIH